MQLWGNVSCTMPVIIILAYLEQEHILLFLEVIPRMCRIYNISQWSLVQLRSYPLHVVQLMVKLRQPSVPFLWINGTWHENKKSATWNIDLYKGCPVLGSLSAYSLQVWHYQYADCQKEMFFGQKHWRHKCTTLIIFFALILYHILLLNICDKKKKKKKVDIYQKHQYFIFYPHATNGSPFLLFACFFPWSAFQIQIHVILWIYQILS